MGSENQYRKLQSNARRKRRKKNNTALYAVALLLVAAVLVVIGLWAGGAFDKEEGGESRNVESSVSRESTVSVEESDKDTVAPVISGVVDQLIYEGDTISYMSGVTATDDHDKNPKINVDSSKVDLTKPGEYKVTYTATDASGNESSVTATITVLKKQENHVDLETIYAAADAKLAKITKLDAPVREQVEDIYNWARSNFAYGGHSDREDWRQSAYVMLTEGRGDCYGYFAVTKLMFERLGIENIDVVKVKNFETDSNHFWSLVSVDGGETYYHFDATPRVGAGDDFCLVTDEFLDAYSTSHKNSHNRDKSLYPATPLE